MEAKHGQLHIQYENRIRQVIDNQKHGEPHITMEWTWGKNAERLSIKENSEMDTFR